MVKTSIFTVYGQMELQVTNVDIPQTVEAQVSVTLNYKEIPFLKLKSTGTDYITVMKHS